MITQEFDTWYERTCPDCSERYFGPVHSERHCIQNLRTRLEKLEEWCRGVELMWQARK